MIGYFFFFNYQSAAVVNSLTSTGDIYLNRDTTRSNNEPVGLDPAPTTAEGCHCR